MLLFVLPLKFAKPFKAIAKDVVPQPFVSPCQRGSMKCSTLTIKATLNSINHCISIMLYLRSIACAIWARPSIKPDLPNTGLSFPHKPTDLYATLTDRAKKILRQVQSRFLRRDKASARKTPIRDAPLSEWGFLQPERENGFRIHPSAGLQYS